MGSFSRRAALAHGIMVHGIMPMATATAMPMAAATPMGATAALPAGCALPMVIASAISPELIGKMPVAVAASPYASQMYVAMAMSTPTAVGGVVAPVPCVMHLEEDLRVLKETLAKTQPGHWKSAKSPVVGVPCMDVVMEFTVHPKAGNQYALTGKNSISCCGIPCAPFSTTSAGAIEEDGTNYSQHHTDGTVIRGTLLKVDKDRKVVTYSLTGCTPNGHLSGTHVVDGRGGTNTIEFSDQRMQIKGICTKQRG